MEDTKNTRKGVITASQISSMYGLPKTSSSGTSFVTEKPRSFLGKTRDFATGIIGGGKLAEGLGMGIAAPGVQKNLTDAEQRASDIDLDITKRIIDKENRGEDASRLRAVQGDLNAQQKNIRQTQENFTDALPTNKEVIGSAGRLAATAAAGNIAKSFAPTQKATGVVRGALQGAKTGALTGATEGALHGAGLGLEANEDATGVIKSSLLGATTGGAAGGVLGGVLGGISGGINKRRTISEMKEDILRNKPDSTVAKYTLDGQGKIQSDIRAQEAIKQGLDEGTVATIKGSSPTDRRKALEALEILDKGRSDKRYAAVSRPSDIVGKSAMDRFNAVAKVNSESGLELDDVAKSLKGQSVDFSPAVDDFIGDLSDMGVSVRNGKLDFSGSDIEGLDAPQNFLNRVVQRMQSVSDDAYELHRLKRYIDENVDYGKAGEGLTGKSERVVKQLRRSIDEALDSTFEDYNRVNSTYSLTREALDKFSDIAGTRFNPNDKNIEKKIGTLMRRILSNASSRTDVVGALDELQDVAKAFGTEFDDDVVTQAVFVNDLERLFGTSAPTSLAGEGAKAVRQGGSLLQKARGKDLLGLATEAAASGIEKARGINEENLIKAIRSLLSD